MASIKMTKLLTNSRVQTMAKTLQPCPVVQWSRLYYICPAVCGDAHHFVFNQTPGQQCLLQAFCYHFSCVIFGEVCSLKASGFQTPFIVDEVNGQANVWLRSTAWPQVRGCCKVLGWQYFLLHRFFAHYIQLRNGSLRKVLSARKNIAWVKHVYKLFITWLLDSAKRKHVFGYMICHCLRYIFVPFRFFVIRHWCRVPLHGGLLLVRCCSYRCCWLNTAVLQRVSAAKVVHQVRGITSLGGDDGLA